MIRRRDVQRRFRTGTARQESRTPGGYRTNWDMNGQHSNTESLRAFYTVEEALGGRGRWIEWQDLDYSDFRLGVNAPVPGPYVLIRECNNGVWDGHSPQYDDQRVDGVQGRVW